MLNLRWQSKCRDLQGFLLSQQYGVEGSGDSDMSDGAILRLHVTANLNASPCQPRQLLLRPTKQGLPQQKQPPWRQLLHPLLTPRDAPVGKQPLLPEGAPQPEAGPRSGTHLPRA